jgi:hypothetical protein
MSQELRKRIQSIFHKLNLETIDQINHDCIS